MLNRAIVPSPPITSNVVFISNNLLVLANIFKEALLQKEETLRTIVLVPSNHIKNFLTQYLTDSLGAFFGVRFLSLAQGAEHFIKLSYPEVFNFPDFPSLALHIESLLPQKNSALARELAHVFLYYGIYGGEALASWEKEEGWQQQIWHEIKKSWDFPEHILKNQPNPEIPVQLISFHLPHIPPLYRNFLDSLSQHWSITYFFRSPTPLYWGDLLSNKAIAKADIHFQNRSISIQERESFESLATDANALLANFGGLGKETFLWLSEKEDQELFIPPKEESTLMQIQSDIFSLLPCRKVSPDSSLQIHEVSSPLREIEVLLDNLKIALSMGDVQPEEVIVLATDLDRYFPYIQFTFEKESSPFGYIISDLSALKYNLTLKTIDLFFSLVESRFDVEIVKDLVFSEPILNRQNFSSVELSLFSELIEDMNIEWGFDQEMKQEILESNVSQRGSWKFAFDEVLESLAHSKSIEISKFEALGNLIYFLETLFTDLRSLKKKELPLADWILFLDNLLNKYFPPSNELDFVLKELHALIKLDALFPFSSIYPILQEIFAKKTFARSYTEKPVISFASLSEGAYSDAKVIFLLGLDEESFPRKRVVRSLNEIKGMPDSDHQPENSEKDRFFFLETLLSAKKQLILSYQGLSETDGKPLSPSLCVQELLHNFTENPTKKHPYLTFVPETKKEFSFSTKRTEEPTKIDIRHLIELVRHPLRFYANRVLGLFLEKGEEVKSREFFLSYLDKALLKEAYLTQNETDLLESLERKNLLPTALFKESAKQELLEELKEIDLGLKAFGLNKGDFFSIHFDPACKEPTFLNKSCLIHPSIKTTLEDGRTFTLTGKLPSLSHRGIYIHKNASIAELWKHLPHLTLLEQIKSPAHPALLFGKDFTQKTSALPLTSLIEYYLEASKIPSPLLPDQIERLLKNKPISFSTFFDDPYLTFITPDLTKEWNIWKNLTV